MVDLSRKVPDVNCEVQNLLLEVVVMDMSSCRPMGASVARLVILISGARSRSWN